VGERRARIKKHLHLRGGGGGGGNLVGSLKASDKLTTGLENLVRRSGFTITSPARRRKRPEEKIKVKRYILSRINLDTTIRTPFV